MKKVYTVKTSKYGRGRTRTTEHTGTLEELIAYYRYTLESGNSYNPKINTNPKTIRGFVSALEKSLEETSVGGGSVELVK